MVMIVTAVAAPLFSGCMFVGDPPPEPNVAPIEVVAKPDSCLLSRDSVAAGTHEVVVIMEAGSGRVRLTKDGEVVLDRPIRDQAGVSDQSELELQQGSYVIECVVDGQTSTADLVVTA